MQRLLIAAAAASLLVTVSSGGALAFNMNVPKSVVVAALAAPTTNSAEHSLVFPPFTLLSIAGDYAERLRFEVINVFAPGIIGNIGTAYYRALNASSKPDVVAI